ncbi:MAG: S8 family serine peptidase, partial [Planctomycetota bacterium]|nr:S8 family serine peptidase [Planctomycetota bacterium]
MLSVILALAAQHGHAAGSDESAVAVYSPATSLEHLADTSFVLPQDWYAVQVPSGIPIQVFKSILISAYPQIEEIIEGGAGVFLERSISNDTYVDDQWHLENLFGGYDINVVSAWNLGYSGLGQTIGIADNGVDQSHPELSANYNSSLSTPFVSSSHGTGVAGLICAETNNNLGVAGIANKAQWSEQLFGSALLNADTFSWANQSHTIKNNSWGPPDDGDLHSITNLELDAIEDAVNLGRGGNGIIFTWAAGNGGSSDRVEYDSYAGSRYTIAVGPLTNNDEQAAYGEDGSALLLVAPSDGGSSGLVTTTSNSSYNFNYGGTSGSAAIVAGAAALILEANPNLTWRDVQVIMARTARKCDSNNPSWGQNGAGYDINYSYGFGAIDVGAAVSAAINYTSPGIEYQFDSGMMTVNRSIPDNDPNGIAEYINMPEDLIIQHVEVEVFATHNYIGDLEIELVAPTGTHSLLKHQNSDNSDDIHYHTFTSVRHLDENAIGTWKLRISDIDHYISGDWK